MALLDCERGREIEPGQPESRGNQEGWEGTPQHPEQWRLGQRCPFVTPDWTLRTFDGTISTL